MMVAAAEGEPGEDRDQSCQPISNITWKWSMCIPGCLTNLYNNHDFRHIVFITDVREKHDDSVMERD